MSAPKLPPNEVLALRTAGKSIDAIAAHCGVSTRAVKYALRALGATRAPRNLRAHIPWTVRTVHAHARPVRMLRLLAQRDLGELDPGRVRGLEAWLQWMDDMDRVVCYDPERGFSYQQRTLADGSRLTRT